jgi:hypothetical protein
MCIELRTLHTNGAPVPVFTALMATVLQEGHPELAWSQIIAQVANYYCMQSPDTQGAEHYEAVGQNMFRYYLCILQEDRHAWFMNLGTHNTS